MTAETRFEYCIAVLKPDCSYPSTLKKARAIARGSGVKLLRKNGACFDAHLRQDIEAQLLRNHDLQDGWFIGAAI